MSKSFFRSLALVAGVACLSASVIARQAAAPVVDAEAAKLKNPVPSTPESIAAGKKAYTTSCAACHGSNAEGADKAGIVISVIEDGGGKQPPDLSDDTWDWGATDGEIFSVITKGVPPNFFMGPWKGRIPDNDIWSIVNYIRSVAKK
jgi:mono/diheme cytochrome c family protein